MRKRLTGFTLIELMVVIGIIAIISALAIPLYTDYIRTAREGTLISSISTMVVFQEDLLMRTGVYGAGIWDLDKGVDSLETAVGWAPGNEDGTVYTVTLVGTTGYQVTATDNTGIEICREFPNRTTCSQPVPPVTTGSIPP